MTEKPISVVSDDDLDQLDDRTRARVRVGPELGPEFWARAKLREPIRKDHVSLRLDHDVVTWFKRAGRGYQTRINAVLRSFMEAHRKGTT